MNFAHWRGIRFSSGLALIVCLLSGCQSQGPKPEDPEAGHLRRAALLCRDYYRATGTRPAKVDQVKEWAIAEGKASAEDFVSTRDNEPYGILFFKMGSQLLLFEKTGEKDKHFLFHMGNVSEVTKQQLEGRIAYMNSSVAMGAGSPKKEEKGETSAR